MRGTVKWFNKDNKFGFLVSDEMPNTDIFVHINDIEDESLIDGQNVEFDVEQGPRGPKAKNVRVKPKDEE